MLSAGIVHTADPLTVALPSSRVDAEAPCTVLAADMVAETSAPTPVGLLVILEQHIGMLCGGAKQIQLVLLGQRRLNGLQ